jgi:hypothetical protein
MRYIRKIRRTITKDRKNLIENLLWFLAGIATLPTIALAFGLLSGFSVQLLSSMVLIESLMILILIFPLLFLRDKISMADHYFKRNKISWQQLESDEDYSEAFNKATKNDK